MCPLIYETGHHFPREQLHRFQLLLLIKTSKSEVASEVPYANVMERLDLLRALVGRADESPMLRQILV